MLHELKYENLLVISLEWGLLMQSQIFGRLDTDELWVQCNIFHYNIYYLNLVYKTKFVVNFL